MNSVTEMGQRELLLPEDDAISVTTMAMRWVKGGVCGGNRRFLPTARQQLQTKPFDLLLLDRPIRRIQLPC
ncbi:MAG: hypothetical protein R3D55_28015 [Chloroflexota bacterium]